MFKLCSGGGNQYTKYTNTLLDLDFRVKVYRIHFWEKNTLFTRFWQKSALWGGVSDTLWYTNTPFWGDFLPKVYRIHFIHKYTPRAKFLVKSVIDTLFDPNIHHFEKILGYQGVYSIHFDTQIHLFGTILCRKCIGYTLYTITLLDPNFKKSVLFPPHHRYLI